MMLIIIVYYVTIYALNDRLIIILMAHKLEYNFIMFERLRSSIHFPDVCLYLISPASER